LIQSVSTRLVNASLNLHGTRSVQKVVELCAQDEQDGQLANKGEETAAAVLTKSLAPAAARLCIDSHGNHVIQRILLRLSPVHSHFVFEAVAASVGDVARHRHGCCVIQRCLDSPPSPARAHLVRRIVEKSLELMQDAYGNYVVQYVLDVCSDDDVQAVCESVAGKVNLLAIQKFSSNVMEKCLERCSDPIKEMYLREMSDPERIRELMMDPFGNYVVQRALSVATHMQAIRLVESMRPHLMATQSTGQGGHRNGGVRNTAGGRRIIAKICRRFPNFTLNPVGTQDDLYSQNKSNHRYLNHHQQGQITHNIHKQAPMLTAYAQLGAQGHMQPIYGNDPRLVPSHLPIQQHQALASPYGAGLQGNNPYYDPFATDVLGGYPGM
jgi:Pumilio-family RNA binding repeat